MIFSHGFILIILGVAHTIFINRYSVPGAGERTASRRAEMGRFPNTAPSALF